MHNIVLLPGCCLVWPNDQTLHITYILYTHTYEHIATHVQLVPLDSFALKMVGYLVVYCQNLISVLFRS